MRPCALHGEDPHQSIGAGNVVKGKSAESAGEAAQTTARRTNLRGWGSLLRMIFIIKYDIGIVNLQEYVLTAPAFLATTNVIV